MKQPRRLPKWLTLLLSLLASLACGALVTWLAAALLPCRWFGTGFEGACGYGVLYVALGAGVLVMLGVFAALAHRITRQ